MDSAEHLADYPIALLVDILDRVVDDIVMTTLDAAGYRDLSRAHGIVFDMLDPGGSRVTEMARRARVSKQAMGQLVAAVEDLGYVARAPDPADGRAQLVRITRRGEGAAAAGREGLESLEAAWRQIVGERRYELTRRALVALVQATGLDHVR
jgi:DNA-binding MarR family transcriptional regulator